MGNILKCKKYFQIKDNLHILQKQNQLQDKQIKQLAKYLNLTIHQVDRHSEMLYEMDTKMLILNNTLQHLMWNVDSMRYEASVLHYFQARIYRVHNSLYALRGNINSLFEYMRILASQELNPSIIPPDILKTILHRIENDIKSNARLKLCKDPDTNNLVILWNSKVNTYCVTRLSDAHLDCTPGRPVCTHEPLQST